jgi:hypothetical protein
MQADFGVMGESVKAQMAHGRVWLQRHLRHQRWRSPRPVDPRAYSRIQNQRGLPLGRSSNAHRRRGSSESFGCCLS